MNKRIQKKHTKLHTKGQHGLLAAKKAILKEEGLWSNCRSQLDIVQSNNESFYSSLEELGVDTTNMEIIGGGIAFV